MINPVVTFQKYQYSVLQVAKDLNSYCSGSFDCDMAYILDEYWWLKTRIANFWDNHKMGQLSIQFDTLVRLLAVTALERFEAEKLMVGGK